MVIMWVMDLGFSIASTPENMSTTKYMLFLPFTTTQRHTLFCPLNNAAKDGWQILCAASEVILIVGIPLITDTVEAGGTKWSCVVLFCGLLFWESILWGVVKKKNLQIREPHIKDATFFSTSRCLSGRRRDSLGLHVFYRCGKKGACYSRCLSFYVSCGVRPEC